MFRNVTKPTILFVAAWLCLVSDGRELKADDGGSWMGKSVLTKRSGVLIRRNAQGEVRTIPTHDLRYRVEEERDGWIKVRQDGEAGWLDKDDVVLLEQAVPFFTGQIRQHPNDLGAHNRRAWAWHLGGQHDRAIGAYSEILRVAPDQAFAYANRGHVWLVKRDYGRALDNCTEAIRLDPKYVKAYVNRGAAWLAMQENAKAIHDFDEVIRLDPKDDMAYYNRGRAWQASQEHAKAISDYTEATRLNPKFDWLYIGGAWLLRAPSGGQTLVPLTDADVLMIVRVPANATVWVNGDKSTQKGSRREFLSSGRTPGKTYTYTIRAQWEEGGKVVDRTQKVPIVGGERRVIDFSVPSTKPLPEPDGT
jgi:uncharacterized protein (TIGR03000 family)